MSAQTLTDVTRNYDDSAISGLANGEAITLNNSTLKINSDVRWGQQAAVFGPITISSSVGGKIEIDGRDVWWIPFDASSGNVPSLGTAGTNDVTGSVAGAGEFLGVWTALGTAPVSAGSAMPPSGFIKLRKKTVNFIDNEVMTFSGGATATINSATGGQRGWIHVVGSELNSFTIPRIGTFESRGDWFYLGETNGSDDQTFQFPVTDCCPAFQMETSVGSGVYEWWLNAGSRWGTATQYVSTDERGKYFGMDNATGVITIARRASNSCGFKPASGLKVRIPNVICSNSTSANWALNTINTSGPSRYTFTTTSGGAVDIEYLTCNWYPSFTNAYSLTVKNVAQLHFFYGTNIPSSVAFENIGIGLNSTTDSNPMPFTNLFAGGTFSQIRAAKYSSSLGSGTVFQFSDCDNIAIEDCVAETFGATASTERGTATTYSYSFTRVYNSEITDCSAICGALNLVTTNNISISNFKYAERLNGTTTSTVPVYAVNLTSSCINTFINGFDYLFASIANLHPYSGFFSVTNSNDTTIRNIGTSSAPLNCGSSNAAGVFLNSSVCIDLDLRRCYFQNIRSNLFSLANTVINVVIDNVWGDGLDLQAIPSINTTSRGCKWTNSGSAQTACYAHHFEDLFPTTTRGALVIAANEPTTDTEDQVTFTGGTPKFNSSGSIQMPLVGDEVVWEMPYFAIGHTKLSGWPFMAMTGTLPANFDFDYALDTGSGFGSWKQLMTCRIRSSGGTAGTNTFVMTSATGSRAPQIGDYVHTSLGTNVSAGTTVTNIVGTTITISSNFLVSLTSSHQVFFTNQIESESSFSASTGFKLKVRATTKTAGSTNAISYISIPTTTNSTDQQLQYPLPVTLNLAKIIGIVSGSRVRVYNVDTSTEIINEVITGTEWSLSYEEGTSFSDGDQVEIRIAKVDGLNAYLPQTILTIATSTGFAALAYQELDSIYNFNAINGSLVTELSGDYPNVQVDSNDADGETTVQRIYAWFAYNQTTEDGIVNFFEAMVAEDEVNYRVRSTVANLKLDNVISTPLKIIGGRIYRDDGETVIASTSNSIQLDPNKAYAVSSSGGTAPTAVENANAVRTELATELALIDVAISSRNATAPDNASITAIKAKTDRLTFNVSNHVAANMHQIQAGVLTEIQDGLSLESTSQSIKNKTDNLPDDIESLIDEVKKNTDLIPSI